MEECIILENIDSNTELGSPPVDFWTLVILILTVNVEGKRYLILERMPSQQSPSEKTFGIGLQNKFWTPPYTGRPCERIPRRYELTRVSKILELYKQKPNRFDKTELVNIIQDKLYHSGISGYEINKIATFTEYKPSPRRPSIYKCYQIHAYNVHSIHKCASGSKFNLSDPEGVYCYRYMPINLSNNNHFKLLSNNKILFLDRFLATNTQFLVTNSNNYLDEQFDNILEFNDFSVCEDGIIFKFDLHGYGFLNEFLKNNLETPLSSGSEELSKWEQNIHEVFARILSCHHITQVQILGDGFIACLSENFLNALKMHPIELAVTLAEEVSKEVIELFHNSNMKPTLKTRMGVCKGKYRFGRLGGPSDNNPRPAGQALITATRLEESLKTSPEYEHFPQKNPCFSVYNFFCIDDNLRFVSEQKKELFNSLNRKLVKEKEFESCAFIGTRCY